MTRNGNGNRAGNGNGALKHAWDLRKHGILWKKVTENSPQPFRSLANSVIMQLQASVQPADALQGLLLDRMAASYLRKQLLLEMEAVARFCDETTKAASKISAFDPRKPTSIKVNRRVECLCSPEALRYEALLDQGFHRDLILLQKLKEMAPVPHASDKRSLQGERGLLEGGSVVS